MDMKSYRLFARLVMVLLMAGCSAPVKKYTMLVHHARIWTGSEAQPWASALLVSGDTIVKVGSEEELVPMMEQAGEVVDAEGRLIVPGFTDCHVHTIMAGFGLSSVKLKSVKSRKEFIEAIGNYAKTLKPGEWILGGDWDHQNWGGELPVHEWIDSVTTSNPVWVERSEGHSGLANRLAMEQAGLDRTTRDIPGGTIVRTSSGEPTGILKDDAMALIFRAIPNPSDDRKAIALEDAMNYFLSEGITSAHHMTEPHERNWGGKAMDYDAFKMMHDLGKLRVRFYVTEPFTDWKKVANRVASEGRGDKWLKNGALKGYVDGAIGSHSALFYDDYDDQPGFKGSQVNSEEFLNRLITSADSAGLQLCIHAIGDKAIHLALAAFDKAAQTNHTTDQRFRIEHTQHLAPSDIPEFARIGVIASMQPWHAIDDGIWCEKSIGKKRAETSYANKSLLDAGAKVAFGSDWWVAPPSPLKGIYAAVTRMTLDGKNPGGWVPAQKVSVEEALRAYTQTGAFASFDERIKGTLEPGKLADFVILEQDIFSIDPAELINAQVRATYVGGKIAFSRAR